MTTKNYFMLQYKNNDVYSLVIDQLKQIDVNPFIIKWYFSFLANRSQHVFSYPQGCVSSQVLVILYTNGCVSKATQLYCEI